MVISACYDGEGEYLPLATIFGTSLRRFQIQHIGLQNGVVNMIPTAKIGHIGLYRDPETLKPVEYYCKMPADINQRTMLVVDPMLATGGSSAAAKKLILMCLVAAPEGVKVLNEEHPDVPIYVAALDEKLNEHGYIVPGLGDAGDRIFGTL